MCPKAGNEAIELTPADPLTSSPARQADEAPPRRGLSRRWRGLAISVPALAVVTTAALLTPRKAGFGTHEELGLPACAFVQRTGYPCPSCGLTTSFAAMAHGRPVEAFLAHPLGVLLLPATAIVALAAFGELLTGRNLLRYLRPGLWWAYVVIGGLLGGWAFKLAYGVACGALPVR